MEPTTNSEPNESSRCASCNGFLESDEKFCGFCGYEIAASQRTAGSNVFDAISPTLTYYFVTLVLLALYKFTALFPEGVAGSVTISIIDSVLVIVFLGFFFGEIRHLFSVQRLTIKTTLLTIIGACVGAWAVNQFANLINISLFDDVYFRSYLYQDTEHPFTWAVIMTCVLPAIFEEIAFRGIVFENLQGFASPKGAVYISAILFGIMHLSFISLLWLIPLGIIFAMLRLKYNTLWYGIIGHFVYNFTVTVIEFN